MTTPADDSGNSPLKAWVRALAKTAPIAQNPTITLPICIADLADNAAAVALVEAAYAMSPLPRS